jgi:riboflavin kinase/FMN adenylyltransferase
VTKLLTGLSSLPERQRVVAIGMFDGVHVGHRATIRRAIELAEELGITSTVLTFDRHPLSVVAPAHAPHLLTSLDERIHLITELAPDELVLLPFDAQLAAMTPGAFCADLLAGRLHARAVVVGENFNFGAQGAGTAATLRACGHLHHYETVIVRLVTERGETISSTRIRGLLLAGEIEEVREILGRPPAVCGRVGHGDGRGTALGVPTANLALPPHGVRPGRGVYVARAVVDGASYRAAVNIGYNPTFRGDHEGAAPVSVEAHLLGFSGDLYGHELRLEFLHRIRQEQRFDSIQDLVLEMRRDIGAAASWDDEVFTAAGLAAAVS